MWYSDFYRTSHRSYAGEMWPRLYVIPCTLLSANSIHDCHSSHRIAHRFPGKFRTKNCCQFQMISKRWASPPHVAHTRFAVSPLFFLYQIRVVFNSCLSNRLYSNIWLEHWIEHLQPRSHNQFNWNARLYMSNRYLSTNQKKPTAVVRFHCNEMYG